MGAYKKLPSRNKSKSKNREEEKKEEDKDSFYIYIGFFKDDNLNGNAVQIE